MILLKAIEVFLKSKWEIYEWQNIYMVKKHLEYLDSFAEFSVYPNLEAFLKQNKNIPILNEVLDNKKQYYSFLHEDLNVNNYYRVEFEDRNKPIIHGYANKYHHFTTIEKLRDREDLKLFINAVLMDLGVIKSEFGSRPKFEVQKVYYGSKLKYELQDLVKMS